MSTIEQDLQAIMQSQYGRDVRQSIHDAIRDIDLIAEGSRDSALAHATEAENSADNARIYAANAEYWAQQQIDNGGHIILDSSGNVMTPRTKLKFDNSTVTDDAINGITIIAPNGGSGGNSDIEVVSVLPTASAELIGKYYILTTNNHVYIVVGTTTTRAISDEPIEEITYSWQDLGTIGGGAPTLEVIATQSGSGTKTITLDISTKSSIHCVVKKGTNIVVSKEIPTIALSVNDVIPLGTQANVTGSISSSATHSLRVANTSVTTSGTVSGTTNNIVYASTDTTSPETGKRNAIQFGSGATTQSGRYYSLYLKGDDKTTCISGNKYETGLTTSATYPKNLRTDIPSKSVSTSGSLSNGSVSGTISITNTPSLKADLSQTTTAKITYSATNTFTLNVTDSSLTLILIA